MATFIMLPDGTTGTNEWQRLGGGGLWCGCLAGGQIRYQAMAGLDHRLALALAVAGANHFDSPGYHDLGWVWAGHN